MPYQKPGVEITQLQRSTTPILITPELEAVVVGNGYWWQDPSWDSDTDIQHNSVAPQTFSSDGSPATIAISGINPSYYDVSGKEELVLVDLLGISGPDTGLVKRLIYGQDFSVTSNQITLSGISASTSSTYQVKVGYLANRADTLGFNKITSQSDVRDLIGEPVSWNPLAFGAVLCQNNAGTAINILNVESSVAPGTKMIDAINTTLALKEIWAIAPVSHNITASELKSHCETYSAATAKKERVAFYNGAISWPGDPETLTAGQRETVAESIRDTNSGVASKRIFSTHPDLAFVLETRHISTIKPSWLNKSFDYYTTIELGTYGPFARFVADTYVGRILYKANQEITETIWQHLIDNDWAGNDGMVTVYAPVPGFYYNAALAGLAVGTTPAQPLTRYQLSGFTKTYGSQDIFSESDLNIMAGGGTWILSQLSDASPVQTRHQVSTDITSVAKREFSVTKAIDYVSKYLRLSIDPHIGRYNITDDYLRLINAILVAQGLFLTRNRILRDFKVLTILQDSINPDTINVEIEILPLYPANYIKITLIF